MRGKKIISAIIAASAALSCIFSVYADSAGADIKNYILMLSSKAPGISDTNGNGTIDVLDLCRFKNSIITGSAAAVSDALISCDDVIVDYAQRSILVPVVLMENSFGIDATRTKLEYNKEYFSLTGIKPGNIAGSFKFSLSAAEVRYSNDYDFDLDRGGIIFYYELKMENVVPEGIYEFSLCNIAAASYRHNSEGENLTEQQCPSVSPVVSKLISATTGTEAVHPQTGHYSDYPGLDAQTVSNKIMAYKDIYPDGTPWTNATTYTWRGSPILGAGCAAFAFELSDAAFGNLPARKHYDISQIKTGDILRVNNDTHSVIVTKINENGVIVAEGNMNSAVYWGRKYTWNDLERDLTYIWTRYPY